MAEPELQSKVKQNPYQSPQPVADEKHRSAGELNRQWRIASARDGILLSLISLPPLVIASVISFPEKLPGTEGIVGICLVCFTAASAVSAAVLQFIQAIFALDLRRHRVTLPLICGALFAGVWLLPLLP